MGGLGKTVTGCALARCSRVRSAFDQIVWLPLGQTPVVEKLQRLCVMQLTGKQLPVDFVSLSDEEKSEMMRQHFVGRNVLLCLDGASLAAPSLTAPSLTAPSPAADLWDDAHETYLNFVDPSTASRVVISTRVRGLLRGAASVELKPPTEAGAIKILMNAAELPEHMAPPREASTVIDMCDRLPLALVSGCQLNQIAS
jgi:hypothetical protein